MKILKRLLSKIPFYRDKKNFQDRISISCEYRTLASLYFKLSNLQFDAARKALKLDTEPNGIEYLEDIHIKKVEDIKSDIELLESRIQESVAAYKDTYSHKTKM